MSFTEDVKNELARLLRRDKKCRRAELLALLRMRSSVTFGGSDRRGLTFATGNSAIARRVLTYLKKDFGLQPSAMVRQGRQLRKKNVYTIVLPISKEDLSFLNNMGIDPFGTVNDMETLHNDEEKQAYLAGAFLGGGTVNRPQGDYHLEMVTQSYGFAESLCHILKSFGIKGKLTERKNDYIVYIKDGDDVAEFLQIIGSTQSYMDFESVRVMKDMRNRVNRQVNCETANLQKAVNAAVKQTAQVQSLLPVSYTHLTLPTNREV